MCGFWPGGTEDKTEIVVGEAKRTDKIIREEKEKRVKEKKKEKKMRMVSNSIKASCKK